MSNFIPGNALRFAGDVSIEKAVIITSRGVFQNITGQILQVQVFEDIFAPFISGSLVIKDTLDLSNLFPLVGEEFLQLKISTPTLPMIYPISLSCKSDAQPSAH